MQLTKERAKENLSKLIEKFERELNAGRIRDYNEEATKISFIQPLSEDVLGWNVKNHDEVSPEETVSRGRVDYGLKLEGRIKVFVEAKPPKADLNKHIEQAVRYGYNRKGVPFVLLTDFEGLKLFDVTVKPDIRNPLKGLKLDLEWKEYLQQFEKLWLLSRESVSQGKLDKLLLVKPKERLPVDKAILDDLESWREALAKDIFKNNSYLFHSEDREKDADYLKEINQRILDRIIFMRSCEDRGLTHGRSLKEVFEERTETVSLNTMVFLREEFKRYNETFDSDLFRPQEWEDDLAIDFKVMQSIVLDSYNPYQFDVIPLEVLGNIYEQYLGYTIRLTDHRVKYELKPAVRKAGGVYYTPEYIVDYIVRNTVGKLLKELPGRKIKKLRILDAACGSGSFLIRAYEEMMNYYRKKKKVQPKLKKAQREFALKHEEEEPRLTIEEKSKILRDHIFGVDIDEQAVEVTKLSLMLKMLEGEYGFVPGRAILPMLDKNIKCGNSLISGNALELKKYFGEDWYRVKPFNWDREFRKIMLQEGGFDAVIGNPPWITMRGKQRMGISDEEVKYYLGKYTNSAEYKINSFALFIEEGIGLLKDKGRLSFIIPSTLLSNQYLGKIRKHILGRTHLKALVNLGKNVFEQGVADSIIIVLQERITPNPNSPVKIITQVEDLQNKLFKEKKIRQKEFLAAQENVINIYVETKDISILEKIEKASFPLRQILKNYVGIVTGDNEKFISNRRDTNQHKRILLGRDMWRYGFAFKSKYVLFDKNQLWSNTDEKVFLIPEKIILRKTGKVVIATIDGEQYYTEQSIYNLFFKGKFAYNLKYLLGMINCKVMQFYFSKRLITNPEAYPYIKGIHIDILPIRKINFSKSLDGQLHDDLVALVDVMLNLNKKVQSARGSEKEQIQRQMEKTDREIDDLVYRLYGITEAERKIIEGEH